MLWNDGVAGMTASTNSMCSTLPDAPHAGHAGRNLIVQGEAPCGDDPTCIMHAPDTNGRLVDDDSSRLVLLLSKEQWSMTMSTAATKQQATANNGTATVTGQCRRQAYCQKTVPYMQGNYPSKEPNHNRSRTQNIPKRDDLQATWSPATNRSMA